MPIQYLPASRQQRPIKRTSARIWRHGGSDPELQASPEVIGQLQSLPVFDHDDQKAEAATGNGQQQKYVDA
jgi:hypothetical protein